jgi:two-component system, sensor histidine kinase
MITRQQRQLLIENRRKSLFFAAAGKMPLPGTVIWLALGWVAHFDVAWAWASTWGSAGALLFLVRTALLRYLLRNHEDQWRIDIAGHVIMVTAIGLGALTLVGSVFIFPHLSSERQAVFTMIYCGWFAGGVGVSGAYARWYYAWAVPLMVPLMLAWLAQFTILGAAIATLLLMLGGMLLVTTRHYSTQIVRSLELQLDLADRSDQLEQALKLKGSFMAATSHDLRQPVTSLSLLNFSLQRADNDDDIRAIASKMSAPIEALQHMLNALMELSQLESSSLSVHPMDFSVGALFRQLTEEYRAQIGDKTVQLHLSGAELSVRADRNLIERVARNLLSNAIKYTPCGSVTLSYEASDGQLLFVVRDTGIGIAPEARSKVFVDYWQADNASRTRDKGLGLGLAIVDRIVSLMNGRIELESELGRGSTFSVKLPAVLLTSEANRTTAADIPTPRHPSLSGIRVLIVDDDRLVRDALQTLLTLGGATVTCCENAEQALCELANQAVVPDIALADYQLSEARNGLDLLKLLHQTYPTICAALLTGNTDPNIVREAESAGARVLHKPVRPERLMQLVESCRPCPAIA